MPNYTWSGNKKSHYGLWEINVPPPGYTDVHVTMNFSKDTTSQTWTWPHVTLIDSKNNSRHIYLKRDGTGYKMFKGNGAIYVPTAGEGRIVNNIVADFRSYGTPCEYLGSNDGTRNVPSRGN